MIGMSENIKIQKQGLRAEAKRNRSLLMLERDEQEALCNIFIDKFIADNKNDVISLYYSKDRELDTHVIIDHLIDHNIKVALPIVEKNTKVMKFALYTHNTEMTEWAHGILQPVINDQTNFVVPDIITVPMLAFDRRGYRLGYGGGFYDATLEHYRKEKDVLAVGLAYAKQACLFNLPTEEHDIKMDWIITEQSVQKYT